MNDIEPTAEMVAFYERRTREHIDRVRRCLRVMAEATEYAEELIERAKLHDASKFGPEERIPYIWLTAAGGPESPLSIPAAWKNASARRSNIM